MPFAKGLNENYTRELMETAHRGRERGLHVQTDCRQAARVLTGWTVDRPLNDAGVHVQSESA